MKQWLLNIAENAFYIILISAAMIVSNKVTISGFEGMVQEAIAKETTKIENTFETEIKKLKAKNGGQVDLDIRPVIDNKAQTNINQDSTEVKRTLWQKLWGKNKKKDTKN